MIRPSTVTTRMVPGYWNQLGNGSLFVGPPIGGGTTGAFPGGYPAAQPINYPEDKGAKYMGIAAMISATFAGIAALAQIGMMANRTSPPVFNSYNSVSQQSSSSCNTSSSCGSDSSYSDYSSCGGGYSSCGSYC